MLWLIHADNLSAIHALTSFAGRITLIYLDPPFFTGRTHRTRQAQVAFDDRWENLSAYLESLRTRLVALRPLLASHGSIVVHVDTKTSHYVKVLGDEVFGYEAFASEIVWRYRRWPSRTANFQRVHDVLLRWVADPNARPRFVQQYEPLAPSTRRTWGDRKQRAVFDTSGRRKRSTKQAQASAGAPLGDVWEIPIVAPVAKERTGYPTQKPEALLSRLIQSCSEPGDIVLDPYSGSGTTIVAAAKANRQAIGVDASQVAIDAARTRLLGTALPFQQFVVADSKLACPIGPATRTIQIGRGDRLVACPSRQASDSTTSGSHGE